MLSTTHNQIIIINDSFLSRMIIILTYSYSITMIRDEKKKNYNNVHINVGIKLNYYII